MTVESLDLTDYTAIAAEVTGLEVATVIGVANLDLTGSALHAPAAGFGDTEFSPTSATRRLTLSCASPATVRSPMATYEPPGWRCVIMTEHCRNVFWPGGPSTAFEPGGTAPITETSTIV